MNKTVKPSPLTVIVCSIALVLCVIATFVSLFEVGGLGAKDIIIDLLVGAAFVWFLMKYLAQDKIYFDEDGFTVGGENYSYEDISKVSVDSEQVLRNISTLRLTVYVKKEEVCNFTKSDKGAKEFIALMKKHKVKVSVDV